MRVLVVGATGATGRLVVERALEAGHDVTAFVRDPGRMRLEHERLSVEVGDVLDAASVRRAIDGHEGVIVALGAPAGATSDSTVSDGTRCVVTAAEDAACRRLVLLSIFGANESMQAASPLVRFILTRALASGLADSSKAEDAVRASGLDWVIVRPARLTNGRATGRYRAGPDIRGGVLGRISRADTAEFIVRQLADDTYLRQAVALTR